ncbi:MAG: RadC family protein [Burkholderiaceae bacterium]|jgi:DNA repair protein RadC
MTHIPPVRSRFFATDANAPGHVDGRSSTITFSTAGLAGFGDERPREKLLARGVNSLSDAELLAVLLQTGTRDLHCMALARLLINELGSLSAVLTAPLTQIAQHPGMGTAKFSLLQAAGEVSRRAASAQLPTGQPLPSPLALAPWLRAHLSGRPYEVFGAAFLDRRLRLIRIEELFRGSLSETSVYPREIVSRALQLNASRLVVFHNHPSGMAEPSQADRQLTIRLRQLLQQLEIDLWAHLLVAGDSVTEFECGY